MAPLPVRLSAVVAGMAAVVALGVCSYDAGAAEVPAYRVWYSLGGDEPAVLMPAEMAEQAYEVLRCESNHRVDAYNRVSGAVGPWQIHPVHAARAARMGYTWAEIATDPQANTDVAAAIWQEQGWAPWSCRP